MPHDYVLIAEPNVTLARTFEHFVRDAQLEAVTVRNGHQARSILLKWGLPRILITNLVLPALDGFALLEGLRKSAPANEVPAIVVSSSVQLRKTAAALREPLGITEIVTASTSAPSLRAAFKRALASAKPHEPSLSALPDMATLRPPPAAPLAHTHDPARLARIDAMGLVDDQPPDAALQRIVEETASSLKVPIALVSLVLEHRQWFKAHVGLAGRLLEERGTPLDQSFCRHVVDDDLAAPLIVPDATKHPYFSDNALVQQGTVGSYAGAPLRTPDGQVLGTLCIIDTKPLNIGQEQIDRLVALARRVAGELELRVSRPPPSARDTADMAQLEAVLAHLDAGVVLTTMQRKISFANRYLGQLLGLSPDELIGWTQQSFAHRLAALSDAPEDVVRRLHVYTEGPYVAYEEIALARPVPRVLRWVEKPVRLPAGIAQLGIFTDVSAEVELRAIQEPSVLMVEEHEL